MIYPNSNLPTVSQSWGRAIQKGIETLEATVKTNEINNKARDAQLQANYVQTNKNIQDIKFALTSSGIAVTGVNEIKNAIYVPGTTKIDGSAIQTGTLSATTINGGTINSTVAITGVTITGGTIKSANSGRHVEIAGTDMKFYDSSGNYSGRISAAADGRSSTVEVNTTSGSGLIAYNGGVDINGPGTNISSGNNGNGSILLLASNGIDANGAFHALSTASVASTLTVNGACDFNGGYARVGNGYLQVPDTRTRSTTGGLAVFVASNGTYHVGSSSRRFKQDIANYSVDYNSFLSINPVTFRYKSEVEEVGESAGTTVGFIAEELEELGLTEYVVLDEKGDPFGINYSNMVVALKDIVTKQDEMIKSLTARIEALESKV